MPAVWQDIIDLNTFYARPLGQVARRVIRRRIRALWPDLRGQSVLGLGFATPYLRPFRGEAERVMAIMPATLGVMAWPPDEARLVALADESELPLPDGSINRALLVHAIESSEQLRPMLREIWRVLDGGGRLLVVVPNRRGIWARFERTPFGRGLPYSPGQLSRLLRESLFTPIQSHTALFIPPSRSRMVLSAAPAVEEIGQRWFAAVSGVVMIEATKEIYAGHLEPSSSRRRRAYLEVAEKNPGA